MNIEQLEREISLRLSLFSVSMAQTNLHLVLGGDKDALHHLLVGKGVLDEAHDLLEQEIESMFVPHGDKNIAKRARSLRSRVAQMQKITKVLLDDMGIV